MRHKAFVFSIYSLFVHPQPPPRWPRKKCKMTPSACVCVRRWGVRWFSIWGILGAGGDGTSSPMQRNRLIFFLSPLSAYIVSEHTVTESLQSYYRHYYANIMCNVNVAENSTHIFHVSCAWVWVLLSFFLLVVCMPTFCSVKMEKAILEGWVEVWKCWRTQKCRCKSRLMGLVATRGVVCGRMGDTYGEHKVNSWWRNDGVSEIGNFVNWAMRVRWRHGCVKTYVVWKKLTERRNISS